MGLYRQVSNDDIESALARFKEGGERKLAGEYRKEIHYGQGLTSGRVLRSLGTLLFWKRLCGKDLDRLTKDDVQKGIAELETAQRPLRTIVGQDGKVHVERAAGGYSEWSKVTYKLTFKKFLRWTGMDVSWFKIKRRVRVSRGEPLNEEDMRKMIGVCSSIRDKCMLELLWESGMRIGELSNLKIEDITFEELGTRLRLEGKTGRRNILVIASTPYLLSWLAEHPKKDDPACPLFVNYIRRDKGKGITYQYLRLTLRRIAARAGVRKQINPHWFRHSRATCLAKTWTESQMKKYFGWTSQSEMAAVYTHLSCRDTDEAVLKQFGIAKPEETAKERPIECPRCKHLNGFAEKICMRCGGALAQEYIEEAKEARKKELAEALRELLSEDSGLARAIKARSGV